MGLLPRLYVDGPAVSRFPIPRQKGCFFRAGPSHPTSIASARRRKIPATPPCPAELGFGPPPRSPQAHLRSGASAARQTNAHHHQRRNAHYNPHTHGGLTTHLVLDGELTISFPEDERPEKRTYGVGERIDVEAERLHEVWIGKDGCTYVIGEE